MKRGIIIKGVGGFYDVLIGQETLRCKARGVFRKDNIVPMVGDKVMVSIEDKAIMEIMPRKNRLKRPAISNIDILGVVVAPSHPTPDFYLVDKLMVSAEHNNIKVLLIINKIDLVDEATVDDIINIYRPTNYPILSVSCKDNIGFEDLRKAIENQVVTLAGQSGVGKSSLINALYPHKDLTVGELSSRISRGRHTTRHTQLLPLDSGGMLADTPGFSVMNMDEMELEELPYFYPDFTAYMQDCKFNGCLHDQEPGCGIKNNVAEESIDKGRYDRYIEILNELRQIRRNKW